MRSTAVQATTRGGGRLLAALVATAVTLGLLLAPPMDTAQASACPCTIFTSDQVPANPSENDGDAVELGVKFRADEPGFVTGIRFFKGAGNTGTHTGSLWEGGGALLATVTFTNESETGWQEATFSSPIAVTPGTTYVASYYAPRGHYAADQQFFATTGVTSGPLTALGDGVDGGNGVYRYGIGGGFPSGSWKSSNYWVDVVFSTEAVDTIPPTASDRRPADGSTGVPVTTAPSATFDEAVQASTIAMTLSADAPVPAALSYDPSTRTVTLQPDDVLAPGTTYTVDLSGATDTAGNVMTPVTWTFTTAAEATGCPCTLWPPGTLPVMAASSDTSAVELGVRFRSSQDGFVTGIRFYKGTGNVGTHVGSLWDGAGTRLASVTFTGETDTGWQTATFATPVPVVAGTTYVASYYAPVGRYAADYDFFAESASGSGPLTALRSGTDGANGVYRYGASSFPTSSYRATNYWVDVVFDITASDTVAPTVTAQAPAPGSSGASTTGSVQATFSEPVAAESIAMELRGPDDAPVPADVVYDAGTRTVALTPGAQLQHSTAYTAVVSGATDPSGNTMSPVTWSFTSAAPPPPPPEQGPGGPVAVVTSADAPLSTYLAEILRTEGLNAFTTVDVSTLSASTLAAYDVVVLGEVEVTAEQVSALTDWVTAGGNLVAMRPSASLSGLLGLSRVDGTVSEGYLAVDPATPAGAGIVAEPIQFHGTADRYALDGAQSVATLLLDADTGTASPAVTLRDVGTDGGQAAAFTYDLARSVVQLRQGNPAWATQERDGTSPIRSDDMFFGAVETDWIDLSRVAIPQADEQQRLLANLIQVMNRDTKPLPRFWYFPRDLKAVIVGTGDDHGHGGTAGRFDQLNANSPEACRTADAGELTDWSCLRFSSYIYPSTPLDSSAAGTYDDQGFEVGVHASTGCSDYTSTSIADTYTSQLAAWKWNYPALPSPSTTRLHCIVFSDWDSQPKAQLDTGMRMDTNYYYWPGEWVQDRPGFMTGSGMPMRFTDTSGAMLDVFQAATQLTDESGQSYPMSVDTLLDNALGAAGYYGAFTTNMHTDVATIPQQDAVIASARDRGVPIISARQLLTWTDGRNASSFADIAWGDGVLTFSVGVGAGADGLTAMLPTAGPDGSQLTAVAHDGVEVAVTRTTVKGLEYATFAAAPGGYTATYVVEEAAPEIMSLQSSTTQVGTTEEASITWETSEPATSEVSYGTSADRLVRTSTIRGAQREHAVTLPGLRPGTTYFYRVTSRDTTGGTRTEPAMDQPPARFTTPALDRKPPVVTDAVVAALPDGTATVTWTTTEDADSVVRYGPSPTQLEHGHGSGELTREHTVVLTDLPPGTTYSLRASSTDAAGNSALGRVIRFVTPGRGVAERSAAQFRMGTVHGHAVVDDGGLGSVTLAAGGRGRTGTFESGVQDARAMGDWNRAVWHSDLPGGTRLTVSVRTGMSAVPDGTWSAWTVLDRSGDRVRGSSRYLQYRVELRSSTTASPSLRSIGFTHNGEPTELHGEID